MHYDALVLIFVQRLSGFLFYALGASFFGAYLLLRNDALPPWPLWWMQVADLPLALVALFYGGASLSLSIRPSGGPSRLGSLSIVIPLAALFTALVILNFWDVFIVRAP